MGRAKDTKVALAKALAERMLDDPIEKISVKSITDKCGLNRQTFYYHFNDIYDLAQWMYLQDVAEALEESLSYEHWDEALEAFLEAIGKDSACHNALYDSEAYYSELRRKFLDITSQMVDPLVSKQFEHFNQLDEGYRNFLERMYGLVLFEYVERRARGIAFSTDDSFVQHWSRCLEEQRLGMIAMGRK